MKTQSFVRRLVWCACLLSLSNVGLGQGEAHYHLCMACHSFGYNRTGPDHCGLVGRKAGTLAGFTFTQAMRDSGIVWTEQSLDRFLTAPLDVVPGTSMGFIGISDQRQRRELVEYLVTMSGSEECRGAE